VIPTEVLAAGDYEVVLEDLAEHYNIFDIGPYTVRFVISMSIYDPEPTPTVVFSNIDKFEIIGAAVAIDIDPDTLNLKLMFTPP
jgi:hypothetical protein